MKKTMTLQAEALIPTSWGKFNMLTFADSPDELMPHIAMASVDMDISKPVLVRMHSECITGDLFGSQRCDCGEQFVRAMELIGAENGVMLYLRQEGRGIGIINKLKAYNLQDLGKSTIDANVHLGLEVDARQYDIAITMLEYFNIKKINLLTNNPEKIKAFELSDIELVERIPLIIPPKAENSKYLKTKREEMGHLF